MTANDPDHPPHASTDGTAPLTWSQVLDEEDRLLLGVDDNLDETPARTATVDDEAIRLKTVVARLHHRGRSALCLSGGGVRSATFALGVLQGFANLRVLDRFDYISTVSGGGFIGGWLTAWLRREGSPTVLASLDPEQASAATRTTRSPVERVRETCRFLAPQGGLLSADVWTLVATMGRNLILNWLVLLPLIASALLVPHAYYVIVKAIEVTQSSIPCFDWNRPAVWMLGVTVVAFAIQTGYIALSFAGRGARWSQQTFLGFVVVPSVVGSVAFTLFWSAYPCDTTLTSFMLLGAVVPATGWLVVGALARPSVGNALLSVAALAASVYAWDLLPADLGSIDSRVAVLRVAVPLAILFVVLGVISGRLNRDRQKQPKDGELHIVASGRTVAAALASGAVLGGGLYLLILRYFPFSAPFTEAYAVFAVPAILMIWALGTVMFIGLASADFSDAALEWWSRCGAWICIAAVAWLAAFTFDFYLADFIERAVSLAKSGFGATQIPVELHVAILVPLLASLAGLAARANPSAGRPSALRRALQAVGLPLVILVLLSSIAWANGRVLGVYADQDKQSPQTLHTPLGPDQAKTRLANIVWLGGGLLLVGLTMSRFVPVNRFSLNGMYKQRLMRTFLGASNATREPHAFTGFDPRDDIRIHELAGVRPLHIVNATLNALSATEIGRNDRMAQPFTFSPLHVGSRLPDFGYRRAKGYHSEGADGEPGLSLGLALAVSGAAASSAMGIYSSKARAFLLTLANARLGLWFGNPANDSTWCVTEPPLGVGPLMREMLGLTTERNPYVYLSDGGHFENLGVYEMVARRCHFIVVSDAGCDPDSTYEALGNALRRIRLDFGIPIEFLSPLAVTRDGKGAVNPHGALAIIKYSFTDGPAAPDGTLVYMRAALSGSEPVDVWNFSKTNPAFPHDPTTDQFFDETRFESYRSLGFHTVKALAGESVPREAGVKGFCEAVRRSLAVHHPAAAFPAPDPLQARSGALNPKLSRT